MAARSRFLADRDPISKQKKLFEKWLLAAGYDGCSEAYPVAILAVSLVDDYFREYPDYEDHRESVTQHAEEIGWISDYGDDIDDSQ